MLRRSLHLGLLLGLFVCHARAERATPLGCALKDAALQAAEELCVDEVSASERDTCLAAALEEALGCNQEQPGEHLPDRKHAPELPPDQALPLASAPYASFFQPDEVEEDGSSDEASALLCTPRRRGSDGSDGVKEERMRLHCTDLTRTSSQNLIRRIYRMPEPWTSSLIQVSVGGAGEGAGVFEMVVTQDYVSRCLKKHGAFAPVFTRMMHAITAAGCRDRPQTVVDLGCNLGLFSLLALHNGCQVVCIEPNEALVSLAARSVLRNGFNASVVIVQAAAGAVWQEITLSVLDRRLHTLDPAHAQSLQDPSIGMVRFAEAGQGAGFALPLGGYLRGDVLLLKVDVGWFELQAGLGLGDWLKSFTWRHLAIELKSSLTRAHALSVFLQACRGTPRVRAFVETYEQPVSHWSMPWASFVEFSVHEVMCCCAAAFVLHCFL